MSETRDLIVLVADLDQENAIRQLLTRTQSLGIHPVAHDIRRHPDRDPGCLRTPHEILRGYVRTHRKALVLLDREGCGRDAAPAEQLEREVEGRVEANGWPGRVAAIAIDPELEAWVWSDSPEVDAVLGWANVAPPLRTWLRGEGLWRDSDAKPEHPKEAYEQALRRAKKPRSAAVFEALAQRVSTDRCTDRAFARLRATLRTWFPVGASKEP